MDAPDDKRRKIDQDESEEGNYAKRSKAIQSMIQVGATGNQIVLRKK